MSVRKRDRNFQAGFTLVEIAIVMVIIGLLIGGVLKGQAMIREAKIKRMVKMADEIRTAVNTFYDKYRMYPGDENSPDFPPKDTHDGDGDGQVDSNEQDMLFEDLRLAGLIVGDFDGDGEDSIPHHPFGDTVRVSWSRPDGSVWRHYIEFDVVPWDVAFEIDTKYDDGKYNTGTIIGDEPYVEASSNINNFYIEL